MSHSVVFMTTGLGYGGAETQLVRLTSALVKRGWRVRIISLLEPQAFISELQGAGIEVVSLGMSRGVPDPRALWRSVALLRTWRPDILTCFMFHANLLGRIAGLLSGVPVIVSSIRNQNFGGRLRDRLMRITDRLGTVTTTNSRLAAAELVSRGVVPSKRMRVIPNGLVISNYETPPGTRAKTRRELAVDDSTFLWLAVGRLEEQKDYPTLLKATRILHEHGENQFQVVIAGQGPLLDSLNQLANDLDVAHLVSFLGLRRDIPALLSAADGFVLASAWEGLPNVVMEALAAAKPVVATTVGGVEELVQDRHSGFTVPPQDPDALASNMRCLSQLTDDERSQMGVNGYKHVNLHYSLDSIVSAWESLFNELMAGRRRVDAP
jgi:glycosyltransferase involved in cell wall biosynthesis